jgi:hypothetical protein
MQFIAPLAAGRWRDVMVNVMFHHINRWKDDPRQFLRNQMRDLFGLGDADLPSGLDEEELMSLYRRRLKDRAKLEFVAGPRCSAPDDRSNLLQIGRRWPPFRGGPLVPPGRRKGSRTRRRFGA